MEHTIEITQTHPEESTPGRSTTSCSLSGTNLFELDHKDLKEHLKNNQVEQSVLDEYLLSGFQMVQKKDQELRNVAHALKLLLECGARWKDGVLLEDQMTPHHLICQSNGDNNELLDLIITCFNGTLINSKCYDGSTVLLYAVKNANLNCAKSLIANGANVNPEDDSYPDDTSLSTSQETLCPIVQTIRRMPSSSEYSSIVMTDILDLLLNSGANVNQQYTPFKRWLIEYAIMEDNVQCVKKLIEKGARLDSIVYGGVNIWSEIACMGNVELVKCMLDHGVDKDRTYIEGKSLLSYVVLSGNVEVIRYLLNLGVKMTSCTTKAKEITCRYCRKSRLLIDTTAEEKVQDPHMVACYLNVLDVVQLLEEYGNQNFKSMNALRHAVVHDSYEVVEYLLGKYNYPLNVEYARRCGDNMDYQNILIEACSASSGALIKLLLDHGADPNQIICEENCSTALTTAIIHQQVDAVVDFIKWGVDINRRSYDQRYNHILPFEAAVLYNNKYAAEMLLVAGCSFGEFSLEKNHKFKKNVEPELEKLMKEWIVHGNNVTPLQIQCRRMILKHLCPNAFDKIDKCSLPQIIVKYLSISELNDIVMEYVDSLE